MITRTTNTADAIGPVLARMALTYLKGMRRYSPLICHKTFNLSFPRMRKSSDFYGPPEFPYARE